MTIADTLRLLLVAEPPDTKDGVELLLAAITARINEYPPGSEAYDDAHRRIDELLELRERLSRCTRCPLLERPACHLSCPRNVPPGGGVKVGQNATE